MERETAMKILKELHDNSLFSNRTALETIIPELADSNDERIRKALLEMVHDTTGDELWVDYNVHKEEALAWLEKQCYTKKDVDDAYLKGIFDTKQGKQDARYLYLEEIIAADDIYQMSMNDAMVNEAKEKAAKALSKLGIGKLLGFEKQGDNNNQNWKPSKGQINALEHFVRSIGESGYGSPYDDNTNLLNSLINDLYKLEKQGEQKPVLDFKASNWYVSKVDGKIHDMTYNPANKVEPKFKVGDILVRKKGKGFLYPVIDMDDKYYVIRAFYKPFAIEKKECEEFFKLVRRRENGKLIE